MQQVRMHASEYRSSEHALMPELQGTFVSRHSLVPFYPEDSQNKQNTRWREQSLTSEGWYKLGFASE